MPEAVINLDSLGTRAGRQTTFVGNNASANPTAVLASTCENGAVHVVALQYTVLTVSRLVVSTYHWDTTPNFDTVVWAQSDCVPAAAHWGCEDDVVIGQSNRGTVNPAGHNFQSMFTTALPGNVMLAAGTVVYLFVAGVPHPGNTYTSTGTFALTVTEVTPPAALDSPCEPAATPSLCAAPLTCTPTGDELSGFSCGEGCSPTGVNTCRAGLACSAVARCVSMVAVNQACDAARLLDACEPGTRCGARQGLNVCIPQGLEGGPCRITASPACDAGLACAASVCVPVVVAGAACDPAGSQNVCASGTRCGTVNGVSSCVGPGAQGGTCLTNVTPPACSTANLRCVSNACLPLVELDQTCDPAVHQNVCRTGSCKPLSGPSVCKLDGTLGGQCGLTIACASGLACYSTCGGCTNVANTCVPLVAIGGECDPSGVASLCPGAMDHPESATASNCITRGGSSTCVPNGSPGGRCSSGLCFSGAACIGNWVLPSSRCPELVGPGSPCTTTPGSAACGRGLVCVSHGTTSTCDAQGYTPMPSLQPWVDACHAVGGIRNGPVTLPFPFTYFGVSYPDKTALTVSAFGVLSFNNSAANVSYPSVLPTLAPDNAAYPYWINLILYPDAARGQAGATDPPGICIATVGNSPNRTLVVEWDHAAYPQGPPGSGVTFQIQLQEAGGILDFLYQSFTGPPEFYYDTTAGHTRVAPTVGLESAGGTSLVQVCAGTAPGCSLAQLQNTRFTPSP